MKNLRFSWDNNKSRKNLKKHAVSFEEAQTVFYDDNARMITDPEHSYDEERFILLGLSGKLRILIVVHCSREKDSLIRIISARKANKREIKIYTGYLK